MRYVFKTVTALTGITLLFLFVLPVGRGVLNIGNITGIFTGVFILLVSLLGDTVVKLGKNSRGVRILTRIVAAVAGIILILAVITSALIFTGSRKKPQEGSVVIVLGCEVKGNVPSLMLGRRIKAAYDYLSENPDSLCIVSGGQGESEFISEAECMRQELIALGISPDRIFMEDRSTSTAENIEYSKEVLDEIAPGSPVAIVTNGFHQYRAGKICDSLDLDHGAVCAKTSWWLWPTFHVREMYGVIYEWFR